MASRRKVLRAFSAGAVAPPLQKTVDMFKKKYRVDIVLKAGKPENLLAAISVTREGDLVSTGAEYVLDDAEDRGLLVKGSRRSLGFRRSVIVVPRGNPGKISSLADLCREGVRIGIATEGCLKGVWDDISSKAGLTDLIRGNITEHADACGSLMSLIHGGKVDAVFGWNAFHNIWPDTCEVVELPRDLQVFRSTAIQTVSYAKDVELCGKFIDFATSGVGRKIYSGFGWIHKP